MDIYILNSKFETVLNVCMFESFIWTSRYCELGDCELYVEVTEEYLKNIKIGSYIWISEGKEQLMLIDNISIITDDDEGDRMLIKAKDSCVILSYRIVWNMTVFSGSLVACLTKLLNESIINPTDSTRKIPNFIFKTPTNPRITALKVDFQATGDNVFDIIQALCDLHDLGFRMTLHTSNQFVFEVYDGIDRSYAQNANSWIIFSDAYENLLQSNYYENWESYHNVALVAGEGEGADRITTIVGAGTGLLRRELYVDARDLSSNTDPGPMSKPEYLKVLTQRGTEKLSESIIKTGFSSAVDPKVSFVFNTDYFLGDIVQVQNTFGIESTSRITEVIYGQDVASGQVVLPYFKSLEGGN